MLYDRVDRRLDGFFIGNIDRRAEGTVTAEAELVGQSLYAVNRNIQQRDLAPRSVNFFAIAEPMPPLAPVSTTT